MTTKKEVSLFVRTTSAKGIPRAAKTQTIGFKVYWIIATIIFYAFCFYQVVELVSAYLSFPVTTSFSITHDPESNVPGVTVCSNWPYGYSKASLLDGSNFDNFTAIVESMTSCAGCSDDVRKQTDAVRSRLLTRKGYFQFLTSNQVHMYRNELLVLDCSPVFGKTDIANEQGDDLKCDKFVRKSEIILPHNLMCYEYSILRPDDVTSAPRFIGFDLTLFLDTSGPDGILPVFPFLPNDDVTVGARLFLHQNGSEVNYLDLDPGNFHDVTLDTTRFHRLPAPHGACVEEKEMPDPISCFRSHVRKKCNCEFVSSNSADKGDIDFCFKVNPTSLDITKAKLLQNEACVANLTKENICSEQMDKVPCKEERINWEIHTKQWPGLGKEKMFLDHVRKSPEFLYDEELQNMTTQQMQEFVKNNFLKVRISNPKRSFTVVKTQQKLTLSSMLSGMGGTLNLFCGISVYFFMEIIECMVKICMVCCNKKESPPNKVQNINNEQHGNALEE